ncbi:MAG TPA: hypothetical protein DER02_14730 [Gammaproteobacteria bacterium]|nr:hypothetical protein [Gammaproteobacteria bacterium]
MQLASAVGKCHKELPLALKITAVGSREVRLSLLSVFGANSPALSSAKSVLSLYRHRGEFINAASTQLTLNYS